MKRSATLVVALVTAAGLFGACSGKSSNDSTTTPNPSTASSSPAAAPAATSAADVAYDQALAAAEQKVSTAEEAARAKASPKTPVGQISPLLLAWATADDSAGNDLDGLTPPAKAAAANGHLVTALHDFADDLRSAVDAMKHSSKPWLKVLTATMKGSKGANELTTAAQELNDLGYGSSGASPSG